MLTHRVMYNISAGFRWLDSSKVLPHRAVKSGASHLMLCFCQLSLSLLQLVVHLLAHCICVLQPGQQAKRMS